MKNVKGYSIIADGNNRRIAILYDEIDETGKVINSNKRVNRYVTESADIDAISIIDALAQKIANSDN